MLIKEQYLPMTYGASLAGVAIANFHDCYDDVFDVFKEEIIEASFTPKKYTAVHFYIEYFQDLEEEISLIEGVYDLREAFIFIRGLLQETNLVPDIPKPKFVECNDERHTSCSCYKGYQRWLKYVSQNYDYISKLITHSAFQVIFQNKSFLSEFQLKLSKLLQKEIEYISNNYSEYLTSKQKIKRVYLPKWLKNAIYHRDEGTCVMCRCDLSGLLRRQNKIHFDHIVPLNMYGTNDPSNLQLLCEQCNLTKGGEVVITNPVNIPCWNLI